MLVCSKCGEAVEERTGTNFKAYGECEACGQRCSIPHSIKEIDDTGDYYGMTIAEIIEERSL